MVQTATAKSPATPSSNAGTVLVDHVTKYYKTQTGSVHALEIFRSKSPRVSSSASSARPGAGRAPCSGACPVCTI